MGIKYEDEEFLDAAVLPPAFPLSLSLTHSRVHSFACIIASSFPTSVSVSSECALLDQVLRYVMMLGLTRMWKHPKSFIVPTYYMDLMWHTHLTFPHFYAEGSSRLRQQLLQHMEAMLLLFMEAMLLFVRVMLPEIAAQHTCMLKQVQVLVE
eukprot:3931943-Rhodomonas_salina.1